ncbi:MAG: hypothetical protein JXA30_04540 [Deltaproteobacteria bacterium]|nr:hypothetical protein [Deltaproteobacteria bacterium]
MKTTRSVIEEIFIHPPISEAELQQRLSAADEKKARRLLTERLEQSRVRSEEFALFLEVYSILGIGEQRSRLLRIAADKQKDSLVRTLAMTVLADHDPQYLDKELENLDPQDFAQLADRPLIELMTSIEVNPDTAKEVTDFLLETPEEMREFLLFRLGKCRREAGVSAATVYAYALRCEALAPLHSIMIDAVVEEGNQDGIALLRELRLSAPNPEAHRLLQGALMRMGTRAIDPNYRAKPPVGKAYLGSCDGQGAFVVVGCFAKPNGSSTTANLCIRAASDIRDGFVIARYTEAELQVAIKRLREGTGCEFVEISLEEAAALVASAEERTRALKLSLPEESRSAITLFRQFSRRSDREDEPQLAPPAAPSLSQVRRLLKKRIYRSWYFDAGDLNEACVPPPPEIPAKRNWVRVAAAKLDIPSVRNRLVAMAEHMSKWHAYRGETEPAALCLALARSSESEFAESALVRVMLERTCEIVRHAEEKELSVFGSPEIRQGLKSKFFRDLKSPKGKHVALLDFTEVVLSSIDSVLTSVPGDRRPRDEEKPMIAYTISKSFLNFVVDARSKSLEKQMLAMATTLCKRCRLTRDECYDIGYTVALELLTFMDEVCSRCPGACTLRPNANAADLFFSPHHPVDLFLTDDLDDDSL